MPAKPQIVDETNDRKYFALIPNYITNHSTLLEQGLYLTLKRIAGETGICFASQGTLAKRGGVSPDTVGRLLKKLQNRGWIVSDGFQPGKTRPTKRWRIVDLWQLNMDYYNNPKEEIYPEVRESFKKDIPSSADKIPPVPRIEEETLEEDIFNTAEAVEDKKIDIEELVNSMEKEDRIKYEYQLRGIELWETLKAPVNKKSEFIRIVRDYPAGFVNEAYSFAKDYPVPNIRYMMFFKKLNDLNKKVKNA